MKRVLKNPLLPLWMFVLWIIEHPSNDLENRFFFSGLLALFIGILMVNRAAALIALGALLILAVKPLRRWL